MTEILSETNVKVTTLMLNNKYWFGSRLNSTFTYARHMKI